MNRQLIEIASWRIAAEIYRKYPDSIRIVESHPGGGMYDCLSIYTTNRSNIHADLNRGGSLHVFNGDDHQIDSDIWKNLFQEPNPKPIIDNICRLLGLPPVDKLPISTPTALVYRFITTFLTHATLALHRWDCRSGMCDTSGYGDGVDEKSFAEFPLARERLKVRLQDDFNGNPSYRFWFLQRDNIPRLCFETTGSMWLRKETTTHDLLQVYQQQNRNIWLTVVSTAGTLMS